MNTSEDKIGADDPRLLIPWYVRGTLSSAERQQVERYLADHPDAAREVALAREEMLGAIESNEAVPVRTRSALDRIMAEVGADAAAAPKPRIDWGEWLASMFSPRVLLAAGVAAFAIAAVEAGVIATLLTQPQERFQTAAGPDAGPAEPGQTVLVSFADNATAADISAFFDSHEIEIVSGPLAESLYRVRIPDSADHEAAMETLRTRSDIIRLVLESP